MNKRYWDSIFFLDLSAVIPFIAEVKISSRATTPHLPNARLTSNF
jgi:hypothetical protein